jgi:hypothetical protein
MPVNIPSVTPYFPPKFGLREGLAIQEGLERQDIARRTQGLAERQQAFNEQDALEQLKLQQQEAEAEAKQREIENDNRLIDTQLNVWKNAVLPQVKRQARNKILEISNKHLPPDHRMT